MSKADSASITREASKGAVALALTAALGFGANIVFARVLGPDVYGGVFLLMAIATAFAQPLSGFGTACKKRFSEANSPRRQLVGLGVLMSGCAAIGSVPISYLLAPWLQSYVGLDGAWWLFAGLFTGTAFYLVAKDLLAGTGRMGRVLWIDFGQNLLAKPAQLGLIVLAGLGATGFVLGQAVTALLVAPVFLLAMGTRPQVPSGSVGKSVFEYARYSVVESTLFFGQRRFAFLLLGALAAPGVAGQYNAAFFLTFPALIVSQPLSQSAMAKVSALHSNGDIPSATITHLLSYTSLLAIPIAFGGAIVAEPLVVTVYGSAFEGTGIFVLLLGGYRLLQTQTSALTQVIRGMDQPRVALRVIVIILCVNVPLALVLFAALGPMGVVLATVIAEGLQYGLLCRYVVKQGAGVEFLPVGLREQLFGGAVMAMAVFAATGVLNLWAPIELSGVLALGAIVYFGWLWIRWEQFRDAIRSVGI